MAARRVLAKINNMMAKEEGNEQLMVAYVGANVTVASICIWHQNGVARGGVAGKAAKYVSSPQRRSEKEKGGRAAKTSISIALETITWQACAGADIGKR